MSKTLWKLFWAAKACKEEKIQSSEICLDKKHYNDALQDSMLYDLNLKVH